MARKKLRVSVRGSRKHRAYSKEIPDKGEPGRTPKADRWAVFSHKSGWKKDMPSAKRISTVVASEDQRMNLHDRRLAAARGLQQLANVTTDRETKRLARADAHKLFNSLH